MPGANQTLPSHASLVRQETITSPGSIQRQVYPRHEVVDANQTDISGVLISRNQGRVFVTFYHMLNRILEPTNESEDKEILWQVLVVSSQE